VLSVDADEPPSSLPQEIMVRLNRNRERIMSICLIGFLIGYFRRTLHIPESGGFYKNEGGFSRVTDCEELSGGYSQEKM